MSTIQLSIIEHNRLVPKHRPNCDIYKPHEHNLLYLQVLDILSYFTTELVR